MAAMGHMVLLHMDDRGSWFGSLGIGAATREFARFPGQFRGSALSFEVV